MQTVTESGLKRITYYIAYAILFALADIVSRFSIFAFLAPVAFVEIVLYRYIRHAGQRPALYRALVVMLVSLTLYKMYTIDYLYKESGEEMYLIEFLVSVAVAAAQWVASVILFIWLKKWSGKTSDTRRDSYQNSTGQQ